MRPRLVQERFLLEKLRAHADELVNPKTAPEPKSESESKPAVDAIRESNNTPVNLTAVKDRVLEIMKRKHLKSSNSILKFLNYFF